MVLAAMQAIEVRVMGDEGFPVVPVAAATDPA